MTSTRARLYLVLLWFIALSLVIYHGLLGFYTWWPVEYWLEYHSVEPLKKKFAVNEKLKFVSHTDLNHNVILTFNDILFCQNEVGDFERYSEQNTKRLHNLKGDDRYTTWPYSPGVTYSTKCCLESNINLHLPFHTERHLRYDGCLEGHYLEIVEPFTFEQEGQ